MSFHVLAKPRGSLCNLDCRYCYFLKKEKLYPSSNFLMEDELLEEYIRQIIGSAIDSQVTVAWQGGEPLLMGLDFFKKSITYERKYAREGMVINNTIQTNGTLIDDDWCRFFRKNNFLVGISIDGPRDLHDAYRVDKGGNPTFDRVMRGLRLLQKHGVEHNALTTIHAANADQPLRVYRFLKDEAGIRFLQFIPIVERKNKSGYQEGTTATDRSVGPEQFGQFMVKVFDDWVRHDVAKVYVQMFDVALANWAGEWHGLCVFSPTCGTAVALEHNGDLYSCDHYVEPDYFLGNICRRSMGDLVSSPRQMKFGSDKLGKLPRYCLECDVRFACHGGCPKDRFISTPDGEPGLNYLCQGYREFFRHINEPMRKMAKLLKAGRAPAEIMQLYAEKDAARLKEALKHVDRNDPCPCGSGEKFKRCHGRAIGDNSNREA